MNNCVIAFLLSLFICSPAQSEEKMTHHPSGKDKCPVCGMFVHEYQDWLGEIVFSDGTFYFFDGTKDLMKFYFNMGKYVPQKSVKDIETILVTEYYGLKRIDAKKPYYVIGSDIYGPMGRELIPFLNKEDAEVFMKDHKGRKILQFTDITPSVLENIDK